MTQRRDAAFAPRARSLLWPTMRSMLVALLSLAACGGVNTGRSLEVPAPPEAPLGHGFDSLSGLTRGACVDSRPVDRQEGRGANTITQVFYARSKEEIVREIGFSGGVSLGIFGFGANLGFETLDRDVQGTTTTFAVIRIQIESPSETLRDYRLGKHAVETLRRDGPGKFYEKCGDGFVAAVRQGGLFLGIVALETVSDEDVRRLSGNAGVSFLGFGVQGGARNETREFLEKHHARYYIVQNGGGPGGWGSVKELENIDSLLMRARAFEHSVASGRTVPTRLVVKPYQVASNLPRRSSLWTLMEQRRFLDDLAVKYGDLKRASAELRDKMATQSCSSRRETKELERLQSHYTEALRAIPQRAEECLNDPRRRCTDRGLEFVDARSHRSALDLCKQSSRIAQKGTLGLALPPPPPPKPGTDTPCKLWQVSSVAAQIPVRQYDADGSAPELSVILWIGDRKIALPLTRAYTVSQSLSDVYAKSGATTKVSLYDRDAFFDDSLGSLSGEFPSLLPSGSFTLEKGQTKIAFQSRCVE